MKHSPAAVAYLTACNREHADCALELITAFNQNDREVHLSQRAQPLVDIDVVCIAEALRTKHSLRILNLEANAFGLLGLQSLVEALASNPGVVREIRLGKNALKDGPAAMLGNALAVSGVGLKVLDLSENGLTKGGVAPLCQAIAGRHSELVELSLHNNQLEADAALPLAQAVRHSTKLRHLHLGYNLLRDTGALQLARCLPVAASLATLDLTANQIGPQGGHELCKVLLNPSCTLQRLNLRNNELTDDALLGFAEVIARNTSLTNLFLGYQDPSPAVALTVLSALRQNRTLLLVDFYAWKFDIRGLQTVLDGILETNTTLRAIVMDALPLNQLEKINRLNLQRDQRALHPIYVGPDDRHANQAAASVRLERPRSAVSPSSAASRGSVSQAPQHEGSSVPARSQSSAGTSASSFFGQSGQRPSVSNSAATVVAEPQERRAAVGSTAVPAAQPPPRAYAAPAVPSAPSAAAAAAFNTQSTAADADLDAMLGDLERVNCEPELRSRLLLIISQLQLKMEIQRSYQQQQIVALEERVRMLERQQGGAPSSSAGGSGLAAQRQAAMTFSSNAALQPTRDSAGRAKSPAALAAAGLRPSPTREHSPQPVGTAVPPPLPTARTTSSVVPRQATQSPDRGRNAAPAGAAATSATSSQPRMIHFSGKPVAASQSRDPTAATTAQAPTTGRSTTPSPYPERSGSEPRPPSAAMAEPPNAPKPMGDNSPLQPDLQHSLQARPVMQPLASTPKKQEQVSRKQPPRNV
jgi:hypothetical protein